MNFVIWTARIAVFLYLAGLLSRLLRPRQTATKLLWTTGFLVFLVHVWAAFEWVHHWSHDAAWNHTARQTELLLGRHWGGGIWFNYLFTLLWGIDVVLLWTTNNDRQWLIVLHVYLAFIVVNATAVFGPTWWRPVIIVAASVLLFLLKQQARTNSPQTTNHTSSIDKEKLP